MACLETSYPASWFTQHAARIGVLSGDTATGKTYQLLKQALQALHNASPGASLQLVAFSSTHQRLLEEQLQHLSKVFLSGTDSSQPVSVSRISVSTLDQCLLSLLGSSRGFELLTDLEAMLILRHAMAACLWPVDGSVSTECLSDNIYFSPLVASQRFTKQLFQGLSSLALQGIVCTPAGWNQLLALPLHYYTHTPLHALVNLLHHPEGSAFLERVSQIFYQKTINQQLFPYAWGFRHGLELLKKGTSEQAATARDRLKQVCWIGVDEAQELAPWHWELLQLFPEATQVVLAGNPHLSIRDWQGANPRNFWPASSKNVLLPLMRSSFSTPRHRFLVEVKQWLLSETVKAQSAEIESSLATMSEEVPFEQKIAVFSNEEEEFQAMVNWIQEKRSLAKQPSTSGNAEVAIILLREDTREWLTSQLLQAGIPIAGSALTPFIETCKRLLWLSFMALEEAASLYQVRVPLPEPALKTTQLALFSTETENSLASQTRHVHVDINSSPPAGSVLRVNEAMAEWLRQVSLLGTEEWAWLQQRTSNEEEVTAAQQPEAAPLLTELHQYFQTLGVLGQKQHPALFRGYQCFTDCLDLYQRTGDLLGILTKMLRFIAQEQARTPSAEVAENAFITDRQTEGINQRFIQGMQRRLKRLCAYYQQSVGMPLTLSEFLPFYEDIWQDFSTQHAFQETDLETASTEDCLEPGEHPDSSRLPGSNGVHILTVAQLQGQCVQWAVIPHLTASERDKFGQVPSVSSADLQSAPEESLTAVASTVSGANSLSTRQLAMALSHCEKGVFLSAHQSFQAMATHPLPAFTAWTVFRHGQKFTRECACTAWLGIPVTLPEKGRAPLNATQVAWLCSHVTLAADAEDAGLVVSSASRLNLATAHLWADLKPSDPSPMFPKAENCADNGDRPLLTDKLALSASSIESYVACPRKYFYGHVLGLPTEFHANAAMGTFVHGVMEALNRNYHRSPEQFPYTANTVLTMLAGLFSPLLQVREDICRTFEIKSSLLLTLTQLTVLQQQELYERLVAAVEDLETNGYFQTSPRQVLAEMWFKDVTLPGVEGAVFHAQVDALMQRQTDAGQASGWDLVDYKFYKAEKFAAFPAEKNEKELTAVFDPLGWEAETHGERFATQVGVRERLYQLPLYYFVVKAAADRLPQFGLNAFSSLPEPLLPAACHEGRPSAESLPLESVALQLVRPAPTHALTGDKLPAASGAIRVELPVALLEAQQAAFAEQLQKGIVSPIREAMRLQPHVSRTCTFCDYKVVCDVDALALETEQEVFA